MSFRKLGLDAWSLKYNIAFYLGETGNINGLGGEKFGNAFFGLSNKTALSTPFKVRLHHTASTLLLHGIVVRVLLSAI
jgi:hypothetical protein